MFDRIAACVFDAYGTLFDVHSAAERHAGRLGPQAQAVSELWRAKQLQYAWLRSLMGRHGDFAQVTADSLDYALEAHGIEDRALRDDLLGAYLALDCHPEAPAVLRALRDAGMTTAILSNGTPAMLDAAVRHSGIAGLLDAVWSAEEVGIYKPEPRVYRLATERLGVEAGRIAFQSANAWDAAGAAACGLRAVWINRLGQGRERLPATPSAELPSLEGLPQLLGLGGA
ncbi:MAG: haloacid dehalogenase type II [Gammaproteobacteria bacterium]|nr:haloacid dehalogenase type II [Gammaproteobacteria bacterium]